MSGCATDFCTKAECKQLEAKFAAQIKELKSDIQVLRMSLARHAKGKVSFLGGAHGWSGSTGGGKQGKQGNLPLQ